MPLPFTHLRSIGERYFMDPMEDFIGDGQSSTVYRATPLKTNPDGISSTEVAVKALKKRCAVLGDEEHDVQQFEEDVMREVDTLQQLHHGHCIHFVDAVQTDSHVYIVTSLAPGSELYYMLQRRGFYPENEALGLVRQLLLSVQYLHEKGIVHRDIKAENLIVTDTNFLTLIDYGLCKSWGDTEAQQQPDGSLPSTPCGSYKYTPPETLSYVASFANQKSKPNRTLSELCKGDMFAVGVVLHLLLSGTFPFESTMKTGSAHQYIKLIREGPKFDHRSFSAVSDASKELVRKLLSPDHTQRPSAEEILKALPLYGGLSRQISTPSVARCMLDAAVPSMSLAALPVSSSSSPTTQFVEVAS